MTAKQPNINSQFQKHQKKTSFYNSPNEQPSQQQQQQQQPTATRSTVASSMDIVSHRSSLGVPLKPPQPVQPKQSLLNTPTIAAVDSSTSTPTASIDNKQVSQHHHLTKPSPLSPSPFHQLSMNPPLFAIANPSQIQPIILIPASTLNVNAATTTAAVAASTGLFHSPTTTKAATVLSPSFPFQQPISTSQIFFYPPPPPPSQATAATSTAAAASLPVPLLSIPRSNNNSVLGNSNK